MLTARRILISAALIVCSTGALRAQKIAAGYIDTAFGSSCLSNGAVNFITRAIAVQSDGKVLAGGNFTTTYSCVNAMARLRTNGMVDTTFAVPFPINNFVNAIAFQSDGKVVVGGGMNDASTTFAVARLNANGTLDDTFARQVPASQVVVNALAVQAGDKIINAGSVLIAGNIYGYIGRLNRNGAVDTTFAINGASTSVSPNQRGISALAFQSGKILVGGSFTTYYDGTNTLNRDGLARLTSEGILDASFHPLVANSDIRALLVQPDGKILIAGSFDVNGLTSRCLARLNGDGNFDSTFSISTLGGQGVTGLSLALQPDGKIILGHTFGVVRITTNGVIDTTFGPLNAQQSLGTDADNVTALAFTADGKLLVGATRITVNPVTRRSIARLWTDTPPPPVITKQPITQEVPSGTNVTFSVTVTGAPPIFYQWRKDNVKIKGATNSTLSLTDVHSSDIGNYTLVATNLTGAVTSQVARLIVDFDTSPLTIITNGIGAIVPDLTKKPLEIGETYTVTARPAVGNLFSNWMGSITSSAPSITFVMQSNFALVLNFVPSPFIPVKGTFNGLFYNTNAPAHETAGAVTMMLDDKGGLRGTVKMGNRTRKLSGTFSLQQTALVNVAATAMDPALALLLQLDIPSQFIGGSVLFGTNKSLATASTIGAGRNPYSPSDQFPGLGTYNVALVTVSSSGAATVGDGVGTLTASTVGRVSGKGTLGDKAAFNLVTGVGPTGQAPVYAPLYGGRGSIFGWITPAPGSLLLGDNTLWWTKPGSVGGAIFPAGFTNVVQVFGSRYAAVPSRTPVLTLTNGMVYLIGGNLAEPFTNSIALGPDNKITGDNQLALTISPAKGSVIGSFIDPSTHKKRTVKGVALPARSEVRGFFLGDNESGRVFVGETPLPVIMQP